MPTPLGSGLAAYAAGVGPAGHDPEDEPSRKIVQTPVGVLYFDPFDRVYSRNDDLTMVAGTGPIQRAAHLLLPLGALPGTARSGIDTASIRRAAPDRRQRTIEDALRVTWRSLISEGQIQMGKVTLEPTEPGKSWSGRFYVEVFDLVTQQAFTLAGNT